MKLHNERAINLTAGFFRACAIVVGYLKFWSSLKVKCVFLHRPNHDNCGVQQPFSRTAGAPSLPEDGVSLFVGGFDLLLQTSGVQEDVAGSYAERNRHVPRLFSLPGKDEPEQTLHHFRKPDFDISGRGQEK